MAYTNSYHYQQAQEAPIYGYSPTIIHPAERLGPLKAGPHFAINASCYVWVEERFQGCMPNTNEIASVSVNFIKKEYNFHLAYLQGTPMYLSEALRLYMDRLRASLSTFSGHISINEEVRKPMKNKPNKTNNSQSKSNPSKCRDHESINERLNHNPCEHPQMGRLEGHRFDLDHSNIDSRNNRTTLPSGTAANFNILINRETYLLLTSYDSKPFHMLTWLTNATFIIEENLNNKDTNDNDNNGDSAGRKRVRIMGGRREVNLGAKVLKEVMIFIGNRFSHWFQSETLKGNNKTIIKNELRIYKYSDSSDDATVNVSSDDSTSQNWTCSTSDNLSINGSLSINSSPLKSESEESATDGTNASLSINSNDLSSLTNEGENTNSPPPRKDNAVEKNENGTHTLQVILVDEQETGKIIGFKGENIRKIEEESGAFVQMTKINISHFERRVRAIFFVGTLSAVERAQSSVMKCVRFYLTYYPQQQDKNLDQDQDQE